MDEQPPTDSTEETSGTPKPENAANEGLGKDEIGRVEKFAQSHLDRVHTISSGATKTALAWLIALVIIWWQLLEPKFIEVHKAQLTRRAVGPASTLGPELLGLRDRLVKEDDLAKREQLELPFSIKFSLPPQWVGTLWLALACGLTWYLLDTRRRVLRLAARGLRMLTHEIKAEPEYVRRIVGEAVWWLAPLPATPGKKIRADELRRTLGWEDNQSRVVVLLVGLGAAFLVIATRVSYVGFCISSYLTGLRESTTMWLLTAASNWLLFVVCVLLVWRWFARMPVPDRYDSEPEEEQADRRAIVKRIGLGGAVAVGACGWLAASTVAFAQMIEHPKATAQTRNRRRKRHKNIHQRPTPRLANGFYRNGKTGTVHVVDANCKHCLVGVTHSHLSPVDPESVQWNSSPHPRRHVSLVATRTTLVLPVPSAAAAPDRGNGKPNPVGVIDSHPHLAHWTYMIEQRALALLAQQDGEGKACTFLADAVKNTNTLGLRTGMRLYDLLAGLSVRFNRPELRDNLVHILEAELKGIQTLKDELRGSHTSRSRVLALLFQLSNNDTTSENDRPPRHHEHHRQPPKHARTRTDHTRSRSHNEYLVAAVGERIKKWHNANGRWYLSWADRKLNITWAGRKIS